MIIVRFEVKKCKGIVEDEGNCEHYLNFSDGLDVCTILNSTIFGVQKVLNNFNPFPRCPFEKGVYVGDNIPNLQDLVK